MKETRLGALISCEPTRKSVEEQTLNNGTDPANQQAEEKLLPTRVR